MRRHLGRRNGRLPLYRRLRPHFAASRQGACSQNSDRVQRQALFVFGGGVLKGMETTLQHNPVSRLGRRGWHSAKRVFRRFSHTPLDFSTTRSSSFSALSVSAERFSCVCWLCFLCFFL